MVDGQAARPNGHTYVNTLIRVGFAIRQVSEFAPSGDQIAQNLSLAEELERPMILLVLAQR